MSDRPEFRRPGPRNGGDALRRARALIERDFRRAPSLAEIADAVGVSTFHLHREFRRAYGTTPRRMIEQLRLAEVQRLLRAGSSVADTARGAGYPDGKNVAARFKKAF